MTKNKIYLNQRDHCAVQKKKKFRFHTCDDVDIWNIVGAEVDGPGIPLERLPEDALLGGGAAQAVQADDVEAAALDLFDAAPHQHRHRGGRGAAGASHRRDAALARHHRVQVGAEQAPSGQPQVSVATEGEPRRRVA